MSHFYMALITSAAELPGVIAAAQRWMEREGFNSRRFAWECAPVRENYQVYVSCSAELAR